MNNFLKTGLFLIGGIITGSVVTNSLLKNYYKNIVESDIAETKTRTRYISRTNVDGKISDPAECEFPSDDYMEEAEKIYRSGVIDSLVFISEESYHNHFCHHDKVHLNYYYDGALVDEEDNQIYGPGVFKKLYDEVLHSNESSIFIRDFSSSIDYEITKYTGLYDESYDQ